MRSYVQDFPNQIKEAISIGVAATLTSTEKKIAQVLICGIGGSGIGGTIVANYLKSKSAVPISTCNEYDLPAYVSENTLVLASSYSGNTEEVLSLLEQAIDKKAEIACITSGGKVLDIAKKNKFNVIQVPGGKPPRACLGYSITELLFLLSHYGVAAMDIEKEMNAVANFIDQEQNEMIKAASTHAEEMQGSLPVIYSSGVYEAVAVRFCQQLNENSKMLAWNNKLPELNHNEIVGWTQNNDKLAAVFVECEHDFYRTKKRSDYTKRVVSKYAGSVSEVRVLGDNSLLRLFYLIHLFDWISVELAAIDHVDPIEIQVIETLKKELSELD